MAWHVDIWHAAIWRVAVFALLRSACGASRLAPAQLVRLSSLNHSSRARRSTTMLGGLNIALCVLATDPPEMFSSFSPLNHSTLRPPPSPGPPGTHSRHGHCFVTHKWGHELLKKLIRDHHLPCKMAPRIPSAVPEQSVVVARNVHESIVSGYLYHRSGHECWVSQDGVPNPYPSGGNDWLRRTAWPKSVTAVPFDKRFVKNPNLCEVLAAVPQRVGLGIYAEFALRRFIMDPVSLRLSRDGNPMRVLYVCMEDLAKGGIQRDAMLEEMRGHLEGVPRGVRTARRQLAYNGSHSTFGMVTAEEREQLLALVSSFDREYFNGTLRRAQALFQCAQR